MKSFVAISDIHAHLWAAFAKGEGRYNSRLVRTLEVVDYSLGIANERNIPWVCAGDLVHTSGFALNVVLSGLVDVLNGYPRVEKLAVWGNHDHGVRQGGVLLVHTVWAPLCQAVGSLRMLVPDEIYTTRNGLTFSGDGYQPDSVPLELGLPSDVGVYHGIVDGTVTGGGYALSGRLMAEELLDRHRIAVVGDVHHPQEIVTPDGKAGRGILIPGSPEHHNFGDRGDHGWWIVTLPDDPTQNPSAEFYNSNSPKFLTVETPDEVVDDGNYYRVRKVPSGTILPSGVLVVGPQPTTVEARDVLCGVSVVEEILQAWMREGEAPAPPLTTQEVLIQGRGLLQNHEPKKLRPLRVETVQLVNFGCYEHAELVVRDGVWLVTGQGRDYPSNGSGKSTLFEALYWALFGRTTKGQTGSEVIRWGAPSCAVGVTLVDETGEMVLEVRREKDDRGSVLRVEELVDGDAVVWEAPSVAEMTDKLSAHLGLTPNLFRALGYFSQERLLLFSAATDGERKEMLSDLVGLASYQEAYTQAGAELAQLENRTMVDATHLQAVEDAVRHEEESRTMIRQKKLWWDERHEAQVEEAFNAMQREGADRYPAKVQDQLDRIKMAYQGLVSQATSRAERLRPQWEQEERQRLGQDLDRRKKEWRERHTRHPTPWWTEEAARATAAMLPALHEQHGKAMDRLATLQSNLDRKTRAASQHVALRQSYSVAFQALQQQWEGLQTGTCPTCGQPLPEERRGEVEQRLRGELDEANQRVVEAAQQADEELLALKALKQEVETVGADARLLQDRIANASLAEKAIQELDGIAESSAALEGSVQWQARQRMDNYVHGRQTRLGFRVVKVEQRVQQILKEYGERYERAKVEYERLQREANPHTGELERVEKRLKTLDAEWDEVHTRLEEGKMYKLYLEYWQRGFGKQGLQSLLLEEVAALFNAARGSILPALTQGVYDVQFSVLSRTKAGELRERTEFLIMENGQPVAYTSLSGGQRRRVDVGVMLILAVAVAQWMQAPGVLGILVLDEVFGFLDASGAEGLVEALRGVQETIPSIYAVTHDSTLQALFPHNIHVVQNNQGVTAIR